jgi:hypothetical protein
LLALESLIANQGLEVIANLVTLAILSEVAVDHDTQAIREAAVDHGIQGIREVEAGRNAVAVNLAGQVVDHNIQVPSEASLDLRDLEVGASHFQPLRVRVIKSSQEVQVHHSLSRDQVVLGAFQFTAPNLYTHNIQDGRDSRHLDRERHLAPLSPSLNHQRSLSRYTLALLAKDHDTQEDLESLNADHALPLSHPSH